MSFSYRLTVLCIVHLIIYASITSCFKPTFNFKLFGNNLSFDLLKERDKAIEHSLQRLHFIITSNPFKEDLTQQQKTGPEQNENVSLFPSRIKIKQQSENIDVTIREAVVNDLGAVANLRISVFYPEQKKDSSLYVQILDKIRKRITEQGSVCLTVERNTRSNGISQSGGSYYGNTIGTVEFSPSDFVGTIMETVGASSKVYVADLAIRPDARRMGLASKMLLGIEQYCLINHHEEIYLHVEVDNFIARKLYQKLGYVELAHNDYVIAFTEARLQKPAEGFILLRKTVSNSVINDMKIVDGDDNTSNNKMVLSSSQGSNSNSRVSAMSSSVVSMSSLSSHPTASVSNTKIYGDISSSGSNHGVTDVSTVSSNTAQNPVSTTWHAYHHSSDSTIKWREESGSTSEFPFSYSI